MKTDLVFYDSSPREQAPMIRVTKLADYGVLLMTWFAKAQAQYDLLALEEPAPLVSASDLARETGLPAPTVGKLTRMLAKAGLLASIRGTRGGYRLAKSADNISVAALIEAVEGPIALTECLDTATPDCTVERLCSTRDNWERINGAIKSALEGVTLADIALPQTGWRDRLSKSMAREDALTDGKN